MNAIQLLKIQLEGAHNLQESTMADVDEKSANFKNIGKAYPVGAAYVHSVMCEDIILATMIAKKDMVLKEGEDIGLSEPMPSFAEFDKNEAWMQNVTVDLEKFKPYAQRVYKATSEYIESLKEEDLDKELDLGDWGKHTLADMLSNFIILHTANVTGEISAIKGVQGLKGYPF